MRSESARGSATRDGGLTPRTKNVSAFDMSKRSRSARMRSAGRMLKLVAFVGVSGPFLVGCANSGTSAGHREASVVYASQASVSSTSPGASVKVRQTQYGKVLVDGNGRALYLFTRDRTPSSRCYGACAGAWPPFLAAGKPTAGAGAQGELVGTTTCGGGFTQVTYPCHSLYYFIGDRRPGEVNCQGVEEFGGTWYVVTQRGSAVL
jgi:predicted lipoprotein with Yx(FWY)xxD motif